MLTRGLVVQEGQDEAANAFLKLLEEPPPHALIVLTSSEPGALLPTIRSRVIAESSDGSGSSDTARIRIGRPPRATNGAGSGHASLRRSVMRHPAGR